MTESRIKEYKASELEHLFKQVEDTLIQDNQLRSKHLEESAIIQQKPLQESYDDDDDEEYEEYEEEEEEYSEDEMLDYGFECLKDDFDTLADEAYMDEITPDEFDTWIDDQINWDMFYNKYTIDDANILVSALIEKYDDFYQAANESDLYNSEEEEDENEEFEESQLKEAQAAKDITKMSLPDLKQYRANIARFNNPAQAGTLKAIDAELAKRSAAESAAVEKHTSAITQMQGDLAGANQGIKDVKLEMKSLQDQVAAGQKSRDEAQQEMNALKQQLQDLMAAQQKAQEEAAKQAKLKAKPITDQDAKLGQNYINKALTAGDISKKVNQLLPKISPTFKGENFNIKKITRVSSKNPNTLRFKVDFALEGGSKKANKFLDSQDPVTKKAAAFLWTLQEDQLSEGIMGAIGSAVGKVAGGIKQGVADMKSNITNNSQQKPNLSNYAAAQKQEPMLAQYLQKILTQAFQDVVPINGKNFDISVSNIKAETNAEASGNQAALAAQQKEQEEEAQAKKDQIKQKAKDTATAVGQGIAKGAKAAGQGIAKGAKAVGKGIAKGAKAVADNVKAAVKPGNYGQDSDEKIELGGFDEKLHEGLLVKDGSFTIEMTLANGNAGQAQQAQTPQEAAPQNTAPQQQQAQAQAAPQTAPQEAQVAQQNGQQPAQQSINIYNGNGGQGGNNGTAGVPDWNSLSRGQKKFLRKAQKANMPRRTRGTGSRNRGGNGGNFGQNLWDLTYGNGGKYGSNWA